MDLQPSRDVYDCAGLNFRCEHQLNASASALLEVPCIWHLFQTTWFSGAEGTLQKISIATIYRSNPDAGL